MRAILALGTASGQCPGADPVRVPPSVSKLTVGTGCGIDSGGRYARAGGIILQR